MSGLTPTFYLRQIWGESSSKPHFKMAFDLDQIRATAQRVAASHGLDVVEVMFQGGPKFRTLTVFIEKNAEERAKLIARAAGDADIQGMASSTPLNMDQIAGVTHEDCQLFSRDFGTVIDVEDLVPGNEYTLEVSSPGLDRKLYGLADYQRFMGNLVKLQTFEPVAGNRHWQGRLTEVNESSVRLDLTALKQKGKSKKKASEEVVEIAFANIEKANLIPEI